MEKKKYRFMGMILSDGDTFEMQEEKPGENPYNPSGISVTVFNHKNWHGVEEISASQSGTPDPITNPI